MEATRPARSKATPLRAEWLEAALVGLLVPVAVRDAEVAVPEAPDVVVAFGVKGAVTPNPGSFEFGTAAAKAEKVLSPVVGGLMAPYMPLWQCFIGCQGTRFEREETGGRTYRLPGTEEPDGAIGLGYFERENANLTGGSVVWHEWGGEAILLGNGVELLGAGV